MEKQIGKYVGTEQNSTTIQQIYIINEDYTSQNNN